MKARILILAAFVVGCVLAVQCQAIEPVTQKCFLRGLFAGCQPPQPPINIAPPEAGVSLSNVIRLLQLAQENDLSVQDVVALIQLGRAGEIAGIQPVPQLPTLPTPTLPGPGQQQIIQMPAPPQFPQAGTIQIVPYARNIVYVRRR